MPSLVESYEVLLDIINDMHDSVSVQLLRDYGRNPGTAILLHPTESVTLILESGCSYRYAFKSRTRVANVTARSWRDVECYMSQLFSAQEDSMVAPPIPSIRNDPQPVNGLRVDRLWIDLAFNIWSDP